MKRPSFPPRFLSRFLEWFCKPSLYEDVSGDLSEIYDKKHSVSPSKANLWYLLSIIKLFRPGIIRSFSITNPFAMSMLTNYLTVAFRNAKKYKSYTFLNLMGLVIGVTSSMLIFLWVNDEMKVDQFHENGDRIYQLFRNMKQSEGAINTTESIPKPAGDLMLAEYPEIDQLTYMSWEMNLRISHEDKNFSESGFCVSKSFFDLFSFDLLEGNKNSIYAQLNEVLISRNLAERLLGNDWSSKAIGSQVLIGGDESFVISGVFENPGRHSSLQFDWLIPAQHYFNQNEWVDNWGNGSFKVYFTLKDESQLEAVRSRVFNEIIDHTHDNDMAGEETLVVHRFSEYYLQSNFENGVKSGGRIVYVRIMTAAGLFLLLIAIINFMNLATARSGRRSKEVGVRKVLGAQRASIRTQFYVEAFMISALAVLLSLGLAWLLLPYFSQLVDKQLMLDFSNLNFLLILFGLVVLLGLFSGSYPALLISRFQISSALRGGIHQGKTAGMLRRSLVVFQFAVAMILLVGTGIVYEQLQYVLNKDLGLNKENMVLVELKGNLNERLDAYKNELLSIPEVSSVTVSSGNPISYGRSTSSASWEGKSPEAGYEINVMLTDKEFVRTMGMRMKEGRDFKDELNDSTSFLINEVAAELMGFEDPIGKQLSFWGIDGRIIGVVRDFHMRDMYRPIAPLIISCISPSNATVALIRIQGPTNEAIASIEALTKDMNPQYEFEYVFLDQAYQANYQNEKTVSRLIGIFAVLSIIISSMGLLGLAAFTAEQRSKELSIRRVHGATISQLMVLLSSDYVRLMLVAFVIATPVAYYYANQWLSNFEFSTRLSLVEFVGAAGVIFLVGILTVGYRSLMAARVNPADTLKDE